jgi:hypothetical protein
VTRENHLAVPGDRIPDAYGLVGSAGNYPTVEES